MTTYETAKTATAGLSDAETTSPRIETPVRASTNQEGSSADLLAKAKKGDIEAFAALFEPIRPMMLAVASRMVGPTDAEDAVMETFLKAWQALPGFRGGSPLKAWTMKIARNCCLDILRRRTRHEQTMPVDKDGEAFDPADIPDTVSPDPAGSAVAAENRSILESALAKLQPEYRVALQLRYTDGLDYSEIAAFTGAHLGTVMSRLFYGKRKLRAIIEEMGGL